MKRQPTVVTMTTLDTTPTAAQNAARRYMRHGFDSPETNGRHAALCGFFMPAIPLCGTFYGWQGAGGLCPLVSFGQSVNPPFVARPAFDSAVRA